MARYTYKTETKYCDIDFRRGSIAELQYINSYSSDGYRLVSVISNFPNKAHDTTTYYWEKPLNH